MYLQYFSLYLDKDAQTKQTHFHTDFSPPSLCLFLSPTHGAFLISHTTNLHLFNLNE